MEKWLHFRLYRGVEGARAELGMSFAKPEDKKGQCMSTEKSIFDTFYFYALLNICISIIYISVSYRKIYFCNMK